MSEAFSGSVDDFMLFFRAVRMFKIGEDRKARIDLLRRLTARKRMRYHRDAAEVLANKRVLKIEKRRPQSD